MQRGFIVTGNEDEQRRVAVEGSLIVGRSMDCALVIRDSAASRQHLEIRTTNNGYICRDLESRNGTLVNGVRKTKCDLQHGDRIHIGETVLRFELGDAQPATPSEKTVFLQTVLDPAGHEQKLQPSSLSQDFLEAAYTLMNALASNFNPCDLVDSILKTTMTAIRAHRGAVLFTGRGGELAPCGICGRVHTIHDGVPHHVGVDEINISETVANRVLRNGENVLFQSGLADGIIDTSASIAGLKLTSILCVPIRTKDHIIGILYIDTNKADHEYTQEDLLLAAAAGNSAGLALQNARNHQSLLEKQRLEQDIAAAWTIQEGFLVNDWPTDDARFEVYGMTQPAKVVGGDFYDFARIDQDWLGILIGDVSGKGMSAALTMAQLLAEFRLFSRGARSPADILARLNECLVQRSKRGMFCTSSLVGIDLRSGTIRGANAGHHPMLVVSEDGIASTLDATGPPIGILPEATWDDQIITVRPGETVFFFTDGIVEARAGSAVAPPDEPTIEYGLENLQPTLHAHGSCEPRELINAVMRDVNRFCSPRSPHDDCTMIALRYRGG
jgi:serine phosphatase RsbU (regulator of sigma subunit)